MPVPLIAYSVNPSWRGKGAALLRGGIGAASRDGSGRSLAGPLWPRRTGASGIGRRGLAGPL